MTALTAVRTVERDGRPIGRIRADWHGGEYIELTFWPGDVALGYRPTEVINVWDYDRWEPSIPFTQAALEAALDDWIAECDLEQVIPSYWWADAWWEGAR